MKVEGIIIKKHWFIYVVPILLVLLGLFLFMMELSLTTKWLSILLKITSIFLVFRQLYKIANINSVSWKLTSTELVVVRGVLPWRKQYLNIPILDIYESLTSSGMVGHFLNFGTIFVRRTEGVTSQISESGMFDVNNFSARLNTYVLNYKLSQHIVPSANTASTDVSEELNKLIDLRNKGEITVDEYEILKQQLINRKK